MSISDSVSVPAAITTPSIGGAVPWLRVSFTHSAIKEWALALCCLQYELVDDVHVVSDQQDIRFRLLKSKRNSIRGSVLKSAPHWDLAISLNELEYWISFFLKYHRDGRGEVDHIDVELRDSQGRSTADLTFKVPLFAPPDSGEDLRHSFQ